MATTAIFAEIIVIGLQVEAWLALYVVGLLDPPWDPAGLEKWVAVITIVVVAAAYMFGVLLDRIADNAFHMTRKLLPSPKPASADVSGGFGRQRLTVLQASGGLGSFVEYQRSRLRVARATALNGVISIPAIALVLHEGDAGAGVGAVVGIGIAALIVAAALSAMKIREAQEEVLAVADELIREARRSER